MSEKATSSTRRYRGRTPEQLRAERRERLLEAALTLFTERGYANTTIEVLCSNARVTTRHFYEQFDGREAVLRDLLETVVEGTLGAAWEALMNEERDMTGRVGDAIRAVMVYLLSDSRRGRIVCIESVGVSRDLESRRRVMIHTFAELIEQFARSLAGSGLLPQRDYHLPAVALVGATLELIQEWLNGGTDMDAEGIAHEAVLFFRALMIGARRYDEELGGHAAEG